MALVLQRLLEPVSAPSELLHDGIYQIVDQSMKTLVLRSSSGASYEVGAAAFRAHHTSNSLSSGLSTHVSSMRPRSCSEEHQFLVIDDAKQPDLQPLSTDLIQTMSWTTTLRMLRSILSGMSRTLWNSWWRNSRQDESKTNASK